MRSGKFLSFQSLVDWWKGAPRQTERPEKPAALERIKAFLGQEGIPYRAVLHPEASGKLQSAGPMRHLEREVVKVVIVHTEEEYGMAVLPFRLDFDLARFARMIEVRRISPVEEQKRKEIFDDCASPGTASVLESLRPSGLSR